MSTRRKRTGALRAPSPEVARTSRAPQEAGDLDEQSRAEDLRKSSADGRPSFAAVRPDYFASDEHKAVADFLAAILGGEDPWKGKEGFDPTLASHALLERASGDPFKATAFSPESFRVLSLDAGFRQTASEALSRTLKEQWLTRRFEIRPGISLRYGEILALAGDYYETLDQLYAQLTEAVVQAIENLNPGDPGMLPLARHRGACKYVLLSLQNLDHFAPFSWYRYAEEHAKALVLALDRDLDRALVQNAFADHFLTDAFASGHLRVPREEQHGIIKGIDSRLMHDEENVHGLWLENRRKWVWRGYGDHHLSTNPVHLSLVAIAVGTSVQRVYCAYGLQGKDADDLRAAVTGYTRPPNPGWDAPPSFLASFAGMEDVGELLPRPLEAVPPEEAGKYAGNYPPMFDPEGRKRTGPKPDWDDYFRIQLATA